VLIHYPQDKAAAMISHLSSLAESRLILSFAPKTPCYTLLKRIGDFFPGPSKATRAYLHKEADVVKILEDLGWKMQRNAMTKTRFYFSRLLEATR
jgi:magnesium-protoporphyrin O-methyltransferase